MLQKQKCVFLSHIQPALSPTSYSPRISVTTACCSIPPRCWKQASFPENSASIPRRPTLFTKSARRQPWFQMSLHLVQCCNKKLLWLASGKLMIWSTGAWKAQSAFSELFSDGAHIYNATVGECRRYYWGDTVSGANPEIWKPFTSNLMVAVGGKQSQFGPVIGVQDYVEPRLVSEEDNGHFMAPFVPTHSLHWASSGLSAVVWRSMRPSRENLSDFTASPLKR